MVATAGGDGLVRLFDIRTFRELEALKGTHKRGFLYRMASDSSLHLLLRGRRRGDPLLVNARPRSKQAINRHGGGSRGRGVLSLVPSTRPPLVFWFERLHCPVLGKSTSVRRPRERPLAYRRREGAGSAIWRRSQEAGMGWRCQRRRARCASRSSGPWSSQSGTTRFAPGQIRQSRILSGCVSARSWRIAWTRQTTDQHRYTASTSHRGTVIDASTEAMGTAHEWLWVQLSSASTGTKRFPAAGHASSSARSERHDAERWRVANPKPSSFRPSASCKHGPSPANALVSTTSTSPSTGRSKMGATSLQQSTK